ncbi:MAG: nitronate monooxygenase [Pseudomonadota bacterium]|nr:nitronate monooxygenase [Pseudomonadota bacterium]
MTIQQLLGIELPIIQAPMAGVQNHELAAAVSNAGGLGSLPCAMLSADGLRTELQALTEKTSQLYNVNFFCHTPPEPDAAAEQHWRETLAPYYRELGIDPDSITPQAGRAPFSAEAAEVLADFKPAVVSFHFGLPEPELMARIRAWGGKILSTATTVEEARWLEARGVDAIIAQGLEAGGHRGFFLTRDLNTQVGTLALVPQLVEAVKVPVIAAGGIADARGVQAAMALGAAGAQVGTAFLLCPEAQTKPVHRQALTSDASRVTALTNLFSGGAARGIVNRVMRELGPMSSVAPAFPLATTAIAPLRAKAESQGSGDFSPLWSGQNARGCREIPAADLTRELAGVREA